MSYIVLARRWRPQRFADLVGQEVVARTLKNALVGERLAHAYLLTGIRGVGKTTIARIMAMGINCTNTQDGEPCGECSHCQSISNGSAMDVIEMDAASHTGVDDVRDLMAAVRYPPTSMRAKVFIIDEAHMLSNSAFNALLKTLEEPPEHAVFILATTESDKLPITVRSRCQRFDLGRLTVHEIRDHLQRVLQADNIEADQAALTALAKAADGSVRDALSLTERVVSLESQSISLTTVQQALGLIGQDTARLLAEPILAGDAETAVQTLRQLLRQGRSARKLLEALGELLHQIACLQVAPSLLDESGDTEASAWLQRQSKCWSSLAIDTRYQIIINGLQSLIWVDDQQGTEIVLMRLALLNSIQAPIQTPPQTSKTISYDPPTPAASSTANITSSYPTADESTTKKRDNTPLIAEPAPLTDLGAAPQSWEQALQEYQQQRPALAAVFEHVQCRSFATEQVQLILNDHQQKSIRSADRAQFQQWLGREIIWLKKQDDTPAIETVSAARERQATQKKQQMWKQAQENPHIQQLQAQLGCELLAVQSGH
ncbi:MAG: DNA polymerase III subunit gamma/tau [Mariprofundales bacterium]